MNEKLETEWAWHLRDKSRTYAACYAAEHDLDAAAVALLVLAIELATGRTVNMETMYDIRNK